MVFKCQEDSFLKEFSSEVVSCSPAKFSATIEGKKTEIEGYEVVCKDTILFPEGGGQPYDQGYLNDKRVFQVVRKADKALHYLKDSFQPGDVVEQKIDWDRRFDHMQQHSGQHLISALLETDFNLKTMSWWMGEDDSYIELDSPMVSTEQIKAIESKCNKLIRSALKVSVIVYGENTPAEELEKARSTRGLPEDHVGDIRVINIEGVDTNMCCGTHVTNLSQLQVVKMLHCEKSKRKNQCLLYFLVGNRVIKRLDECLTREQKLTVLLNNGPNEHVSLVDNLLKTGKSNNKKLQTVLKEMAVIDAKRIKDLDPKPKYFSLHKSQAEADYMNTIVREVNSTDMFLFLSTGDEKSVGNILLYGNEKVIADLGNEISKILDGKGAGKGTRFQAKVTAMKNRSKAEDLIREYFK